MHSQKKICLVKESCLPKPYQIVNQIEQAPYQKDFWSKMNNVLGCVIWNYFHKLYCE